jgi:predicted GNAT family acetyltransferase
MHAEDGRDAAPATGAGPEAATAIRHDADDRRFSTIVDRHKAFVEYERVDDVLVVTHTWVPKEIGGRGIAGQLVRAALDFARDQDLKVRPECTYADAWMRRHPDYDALRAA